MTSKWYKNPSLVVSIFSIFAATLVGILSIINSRAIAHLDKDVYVPKLAYRIGQEEIGKIYVEIINQGSVSAKNVILILDWNIIEIKDCASQPPFQNHQPVQPILPKNLTFKAESLFPGGIYKIICNIDMASPYNAVDNSTSDGTPVAEVYVGTPTAVVEEMQIPDTFNITILTTIELNLQSDFMRVNVIAENSLPATEIGRPQKIRIFTFVSPEALAQIVGGDPAHWKQAGPVVWVYSNKDHATLMRHPGDNMILTYWAGFGDPQNADDCQIITSPVNSVEKYVKCPSGTQAQIVADQVGLHLIDYTSYFP
jgi:hypothetical protein